MQDDKQANPEFVFRQNGLFTLPSGRTVDQHIQHKDKKGNKQKREENIADDGLFVEGG